MKYICEICNRPFISYNANPKFCSIKCKAESQTTSVCFERAKELYENGFSQIEVAEFLGTSQKVITMLFKRNHYKSRKAAKRNQDRENNASWKGKEAGIQAVHRRLYVLYGKPQKCSICKTKDINKKYDYANITGKHETERDYLPMCRSCHSKYDKKHRNFKKQQDHQKGVITNACVQSY